MCRALEQVLGATAVDREDNDLCLCWDRQAVKENKSVQ